MPGRGKRETPVQTRWAHASVRRARPAAGSLPAGVTPLFPVVGIGASAGGLDALKAFFAAMPFNSGLAFVVVVHLDPTHDSLMPELLARASTLSVEQARDGQSLEADHVYVIPPNRTLTISQGLIRVREVADRQALRGSIDHFFRSLADAQRDRAIAIVLSGTGTEGTLGARAIKSEGGMVMAQAPETASQPGMPASVAGAGLVDFVLAPGDMPKALLDYVRDMPRQPGPRRAAPVAQPPNDLQAVLAILRSRAKHDFRGYKVGTLQRRIERRMGLRHIGGIAEYVEYLRAHPDEVDRLFQDLLIGVTSFFRDPPAFDELASTVLAGLIRRRDSDRPIRIWVPGCATGEETYSIAIVAAEQLAEAQSACRVQIFATDVDERALDIARAGTYPESIALDVTPRRLQRFFTRDDHRYTILKSLRESVTFAAQNIVSDPPFSRLDLVSCRNVLIYLEREVQEKLVALFHFALEPDGYLFLGNAESIATFEDLFAPISKPRRIFRRLTLGTVPQVELPAPRSPVDAHHLGTISKPAPAPTVAAAADRQLLEHLAPAAVVVRGTGQIVRFYGAMDRYLHLPTGEATLNVLTLAHDALKPALRAALHYAVRRHRPRVLDVLDTSRAAGSTVRLTVTPLDDPAAPDSFWLAVFEERPSTALVPARPARGKQRDLARRLEAELRATKKEQEQLVEQLESSNEELKAANEEILSMNEELQSTNEELETSKEELQSMNEELTTLNAQLQDKVQELTSVNDDLANLIVSTEIATVFLDTEFRIKRFTTAATLVLNVLPSDRGRPISHIATNLVDVDLAADARAVLESLTSLEREAASHDGQQYQVRVFPYRTADRAVQGVVVTLVNVTTLKQTASRLRATQDELRLLNEQLEQRVAERTRWLALTHSVTRAISEASGWNEALHRVLRCLCESLQWQLGCVYLPDRDMPDRLVPVVSFVEDERFRPREGGLEHPRDPLAPDLTARVYRDGVPLWVSDPNELEALSSTGSDREVPFKAAAVLPVTFGQETIAVMALLSDRPHESSGRLADLMSDLNAQIGKVVERERLMARMTDLVWRDQQDLLHTLHDSLGQTLTAVGMLSAGLKQRLIGADDAAVNIAQQIAHQAQSALEQVRQVSKGLFPIDVDAQNFIPALRQLASMTEAVHRIRVQVNGHESGVYDARTATQLYRIVQEAVTNAVKHARARSIIIGVRASAGSTTISISDDGVGIETGSMTNAGIGLHIMRSRAGSIGAHFSISRGVGGGTRVVCTVRDPQTPIASSST